MIWEVLFLMLMSSVGKEFEQDTVQMAFLSSTRLGAWTHTHFFYRLNSCQSLKWLRAEILWRLLHLGIWLLGEGG